MPLRFGDDAAGAVLVKAGHVVDLQAGGELSTKLGGVKAFVAKAPDFRVNYTKGKFPLTFTVKSPGDTTLLINLPDGTWIADPSRGELAEKIGFRTQAEKPFYDLAIVGGGPSGLAAAVYGASEGLRTLLIGASDR